MSWLSLHGHPERRPFGVDPSVVFVSSVLCIACVRGRSQGGEMGVHHISTHRHSLVQKLRRDPTIEPATAGLRTCASLGEDMVDPGALHLLVVNFVLPWGENLCLPA